MISDVLDAAIGVLFVFLMVSTVCASIREGLESFLKTRARYLEHAIFSLLAPPNDPTQAEVAQRWFAHPMIKGLFLGDHTPSRGQPPGVLSKGAANMPSYIPSKNFSLALIDVVARYQAPTSALPPISLQSLRETAARLPAGEVRTVLETAIATSETGLEEVRVRIEQWYDSAMERVSGRYKRASQWIILAIAAVVVGTLNIDTLAIADQVYRDKALRDATITAVESSSAGLDHAGAVAYLRTLHLPIGWSAWPTLSWAGARQLVGLSITIFATMLGAPFWFDLLNKVMVIRATVKPHEKSKEEESED